MTGPLVNPTPICITATVVNQQNSPLNSHTTTNGASFSIERHIRELSTNPDQCQRVLAGIDAGDPSIDDCEENFISVGFCG